MAGRERANRGGVGGRGAQARTRADAPGPRRSPRPVDRDTLPRTRLSARGRPEMVDAAPHGRQFAVSLLLLVGLLGFSLYGFVVGLDEEEALPIPLVEVPNVRSATLEDADAALTELGLVVQPRFEPNEDLAPGTVSGQDPRSGQRAELGSTIVLVVSTGKVGTPLPDVLAQPEVTAVEAMSASGFVVTVERRFTDRLAAGLVITTEPQPGSVLQAGEPVTVIVSDGPRSREVPLIVDLPIEHAMIQLGKQGLLPGEIEEVQVPDRDAGIVLEQDPAPGTRVAKDTPVNIRVSAGPPTVLVPYVEGLLQASAEEQAGAANVRYFIRTEAASDPNYIGRVLRQSIPGGSSITQRTVLAITVGVAPGSAEEEDDDGGD